jgi:hypothetical protein
MAKKGSYTRHRQKRREYTDDEVREIREVYKNGDHTLASLGEKYNLTKSQVKYVLYNYVYQQEEEPKKKKIGFFNKRLQKWLSFPPDDE